MENSIEMVATENAKTIAQSAEVSIGTRNPSELGNDEQVFQDLEGYYYNLSEPLKWAGKQGKVVPNPALKLRAIPEMMRTILSANSSDFKPLYEALQKVYDASPETVDIDAFAADIAKRKAALLTDGKKIASFRTTESDRGTLWNIHLQTKWNADTISEKVGIGSPTVGKVLKSFKEKLKS